MILIHFATHIFFSPLSLTDTLKMWMRGLRFSIAKALFKALFLVCLFGGSGTFVILHAGEPLFPKLSSPVVDEAFLLSTEEESSLKNLLQSLEAISSDQVVIVTVPSLQGFSIEEYGYKLGREWGLGHVGKDNGVLLIVAPSERKVRIEVGKRLEPLLTDAMSKLIITNAILPAFRRGEFGAGIVAGIRDIQDVLLGDEEAVKQRAQNTGQVVDNDTMANLIMLIWIAILFYVVWRQQLYWRELPSTRGSRLYRRRRDDETVVLPGGWGHWNGGGRSGGGWSGGGGTFSGGGASGSW